MNQEKVFERINKLRQNPGAFQKLVYEVPARDYLRKDFKDQGIEIVKHVSMTARLGVQYSNISAVIQERADTQPNAYYKNWNWVDGYKHYVKQNIKSGQLYVTFETVPTTQKNVTYTINGKPASESKVAVMVTNKFFSRSRGDNYFDVKIENIVQLGEEEKAPKPTKNGKRLKLCDDAETLKIFDEVVQEAKALGYLDKTTIEPLRVNKSTTKANGYCSSDRVGKQRWLSTVSINERVIGHPEAVKCVIVHEVAHACLPEAAHNAKWKKIGDKIGQKFGVSVHRTDDYSCCGVESWYDEVKAKYALKCETCGRIWHYRRKVYAVQHPKRCKCPYCKVPVVHCEEVM